MYRNVISAQRPRYSANESYLNTRCSRTDAFVFSSTTTASAVFCFLSHWKPYFNFVPFTITPAVICGLRNISLYRNISRVLVVIFHNDLQVAEDICLLSNCSVLSMSAAVCNAWLLSIHKHSAYASKIQNKWKLYKYTILSNYSDSYICRIGEEALPNVWAKKDHY